MDQAGIALLTAYSKLNNSYNSECYGLQIKQSFIIQFMRIEMQ